MVRLRPPLAEVSLFFPKSHFFFPKSHFFFPKSHFSQGPKSHFDVVTAARRYGCKLWFGVACCVGSFTAGVLGMFTCGAMVLRPRLTF